MPVRVVLTTMLAVLDDLLAELLHERRPEWMRDALCREHPDLAWFPTTRTAPAEVEKAKAVCARCLVRVECFEYALADSWLDHGIWSGTSGRERVRVRQARARADREAA